MKYKVKKPFLDKENDLIERKLNEIIDITEKRAKEIMKTLGEESLEKVKKGEK